MLSPASPEQADRPGWHIAHAYLQHGLGILRPHWPVYLQVLLVYAAPALLAAYLMMRAVALTRWDEVGILTLPWVTAILGTVVVMIVVGYHARGQAVSLARASWEALFWLPRYVWTNAHTTVIFWLPVGVLLEARQAQERLAPVDGVLGPVLALGWWVTIAVVAVCVHTRTLLAPFLAVHGDLPATLATLEAWRLSGRHFTVCLGTFVVASLPVTLPLAVLVLVAVLLLGETARALLVAAAPALLWVAIQAVRLVLMPAVYVLYRDLWYAEIERRRQAGAPPVPWLARVLSRVTRRLPHPPTWRHARW